MPDELRFDGCGLACVSCWVLEARFFKGLPIYSVYASASDYAIRFDTVSRWMPPRGQVYLELCVGPADNIVEMLAHPFASRAAWLDVYGPLDMEAASTDIDPRLADNRARVRVARGHVQAIAAWPRLRSLIGVSLLQIEPEALPIVSSDIAPHGWTTIDGKATGGQKLR